VETYSSIGKSKESAVAPKCSCKPVLVCEDEPFNYHTFQYILKSLNFDSDWACNGKEGVEMFAKSFECCPYKIVFMDCAMPVLNGYGANEKIIQF